MMEGGQTFYCMVICDGDHRLENRKCLVCKGTEFYEIIQTVRGSKWLNADRPRPSLCVCATCGGIYHLQ
jgi:hypothetical protein